MQFSENIFVFHTLASEVLIRSECLWWCLQQVTLIKNNKKITSVKLYLKRFMIFIHDNYQKRNRNNVSFRTKMTWKAFFADSELFYLAQNRFLNQSKMENCLKNYKIRGTKTLFNKSNWPRRIHYWLYYTAQFE